VSMETAMAWDWHGAESWSIANVIHVEYWRTSGHCKQSDKEQKEVTEDVLWVVNKPKCIFALTNELAKLNAESIKVWLIKLKNFSIYYIYIISYIYYILWGLNSHMTYYMTHILLSIFPENDVRPVSLTLIIWLIRRWM
jgi:hypothetical protein